MSHPPICRELIRTRAAHLWVFLNYLFPLRKFGLIQIDFGILLFVVGTIFTHPVISDQELSFITFSFQNLIGKLSSPEKSLIFVSITTVQIFTMGQKVLLNAKEVNIILHRLACQLIENHTGFENSVLIGIQPRGVYLTSRIQKILSEEYQIKDISSGALDITFYRDDFRRSGKPLEANKTNIDFVVEDKRVVFIDDVLYTGRSIRAALTAIQSFGRPRDIELLTLIDRRFSRHLPIQPDYNGRQVDAINEEKVIVNWKENEGEDAVYLINK